MSIPKRLVALVLERDGHTCMIAGPDCLIEASVADHRAVRGMGGAKILNDPACLIAACGLCNGWREDATGADREWLIDRGVRVLPAATHRQTLQRCRMQPVQDPFGVWLFLTSDGRREVCTAPEF